VEYLAGQASLVNLNLGRMDFPEAQRNMLIEEIGKRNGGSLEMNRYQSKRTYPAHADSRAIKSVYR
jgi:hypothetical protein